MPTPLLTVDTTATALARIYDSDGSYTLGQAAPGLEFFTVHAGDRTLGP